MGVFHTPIHPFFRLHLASAEQLQILIEKGQRVQ